MFNPNNTKKRILDRIATIKRPKRKVIVQKPKKVLKSDKKVKELLTILDSKEKATVKLEKFLKHLK